MGNMFFSQNKNKWNLLVEYVTGKASNNEIMKNVIDERNNHKVKSLEEWNIQKSKRQCKRKQTKLNRILRNGGNPAESDAFRTMSYSPLKTFNDHSSNNINGRKEKNDTILDRRECMSKSPDELNSLTIDESCKNNLKPIHPV